MTVSSLIRVGGWTAGLVLGASAFGMAWATQVVQIPLWAAFVLTFIPTRDLIVAVQDIIDAVTDRISTDTTQGQDSTDD